MSFNQLVPQGSQPPPSLNSSNSNINPKSRKPYTITKQRENWTDDEHQKFLEALTLFDRDWKKIEGFVGTKTVIQIRSHAQKYFIKVQKNNTGERIPPPRPKRKSIQPYPQKAKNGGIGMSSDLAMMNGMMPDSLTGNPFLTPTNFTSWMAYRGLMPPLDMSTSGGGIPNMNGGGSGNGIGSPVDTRAHLEQLHQAQQYIQSALSVAQNNNNNNTTNTNNRNGNNSTGGSASGQLSPNYPKIYSFLSTLFESNTSSYTDSLNEMSQIDRETMQLLMHNLAINLANQQYRDQHQSLLDQCGNGRMGLKNDDDEEIISSPRSSNDYNCGDTSLDSSSSFGNGTNNHNHHHNGQNNNNNNIYTMNNTNNHNMLNSLHSITHPSSSLQNPNGLSMNLMAMNSSSSLQQKQFIQSQPSF